MAWKIAVQSITWGLHRSLDEMLSEAKAAGFSGVELFQHPDELGGAQKILDAFTRSGLTLVGVTCGSFDDRCDLVRKIAELRHVGLSYPTLPYVYTDEWREHDPRFKQALDEGFRAHSTRTCTSPYRS